jgi:hypothetical protein
MGTGTLGKATMSIALENDDKNFVKISINKFYRLEKAIKLQASQMLRFRTFMKLSILRNVTIPLPLKLTVLLHV